ncbi:NAD(P)-dependent iron-only hydrogenase catalytic subunit [Hydrogenispora ethanolica]|uniref:NAD(P)-dependent iron-only hydrogenase catalytic subunit n=1 Tax=Hydrogenispora ethanolica TaxID=1082276 RepID=A0A4R1QP64_HYDET|nr:NADH-dependent [FeFe] hydrogenase, group A6 [Hydrogenispora ethanolica]TCL55586.1 NAD(P)-dependent iron-only hydrogenase catalytic subunit [Hydrogenispora ethanolica]
MVNLTINRKPVAVPEGTTIFEAARQNNILIPHFCYLEGVHQIGSCRICVVEVEGAKTLQASCMVTAQEGMVVHTHTEKVRKARQILYELMLSDHPRDCLSCGRNQNCEFQKLGELLQISDLRFEGERSHTAVDTSSPSIVRDTAKCILCRRCVTICNQIQGVGVLNAQKRGFKTVIGPAADLPLNSADCAFCGQCTTVCPVGALQEKDSTQPVWRALFAPDKRVIIQTAPAIRAALGEEFGLEPGTLVTGKMITALREMGFDAVFDTNFAADLTIIEEGHELLARISDACHGKPAELPMVTSCSPGWIKYIEHRFPQKLGHLSTCKSPHMMLGALVKSFYAARSGVAPQDLFVVSVMPCTAKKFEITRPELANDGYPNVDAVLTTRELAKMIKDAGIDFEKLADGQFDDPLGLSTGAADIFATSGGVMEAALRTVHEVVTGRELPFDGLRITPLSGLSSIKTAEITITDPLEAYDFLNGVTLKVAVTSGLSGARKLMEQVAQGESPYHFIEVMGCPGGCISGGGQPRPTNNAIRQKRMAAIYQEDEGKELRKSHQNPFITRLYQEYLEKPLGHKSHELLHTHYTARGSFADLLEKNNKDRG